MELEFRQQRAFGKKLSFLHGKILTSNDTTLCTLRDRECVIKLYILDLLDETNLLDINKLTRYIGTELGRSAP